MIKGAKERDQLFQVTKEESLVQERLGEENRRTLLVNDLLKRKECNCTKASYIDRLSHLDAFVVQNLKRLTVG